MRESLLNERWNCLILIISSVRAGFEKVKYSRTRFREISLISVYVRIWKILGQRNCINFNRPNKGVVVSMFWDMLCKQNLKTISIFRALNHHCHQKRWMIAGRVTVTLRLLQSKRCMVGLWRSCSGNKLRLLQGKMSRRSRGSCDKWGSSWVP